MKVHNPLQGFDPTKHELYSKSGCNKCYGRGWVGWNSTVKEYTECVCLRYRDKAIIEPVQSAPESVAVVDEV